VAQEWAETIEPMEPNPENHERYMEYFALYRRLYEHLADDFQALACIRDRA
jgi:xylulokinase